MAFKELSPEGKEALLNLVRALARRRARLDYADEISRHCVPADPANATREKPAKRQVE